MTVHVEVKDVGTFLEVTERRGIILREGGYRASVGDGQRVAMRISDSFFIFFEN